MKTFRFWWSVLALTLAGCSGGSSNELVGTWYSADSTETMQIFSDGSIKVNGDLPVAGEYSFPDAGYVRFDLGGLAELIGPQIFEYKIDEDRLTLVESGGKTHVYSRNRSDSGSDRAVVIKDDGSSELSFAAKRALAGIWRSKDDSHSIFFAMNGLFRFYLPEADGRLVTDEQLTGTYSGSDNQTLLLTYSDGSGKDIYSYSILGNVLTLTDKSGVVSYSKGD